MRNIWVLQLGTVVALALLAWAGMASPNAQGDAIAAKCPRAAAWVKQQKLLHPGESQQARARRDAGRTFTRPALRKDLLRRAADDGRLREAWIASGRDPHSKQGKAVYTLDGRNLAWLKPKVVESGFPTVAEVGEQGVAAAWLLVQHADRDPAFQLRVLRALEPHVAQRGVPLSDYAMLMDRALRHEGKPQRYGSQWTVDPAKPGQLVLEPTEDPTHLNERRARAGLMPIKDYQCVLDTVYAPAVGRGKALHKP